MNRIEIKGVIAHTPTYWPFPSVGPPRLRLAVTVDMSKEGETGQENLFQWFTVVAIEELAKKGATLEKGDAIHVIGAMRSRKARTSDKFTVWELRAEEIKMWSL